MLYEFLLSHRDELLWRCKCKMARRFTSARPVIALHQGMPLFLQQLVEALSHDRLTTERVVAGQDPAPTFTAIGRAAAAHGVEMMQFGYTLDQVVHSYGDLCQAITEMAVEQNMPISADEFHTFNRCMDDAIADAVTSFAGARQVAADEEAETVNRQLHLSSSEQRRLIDAAIQAVAALRFSDTQLKGKTGTQLLDSLEKLRTLSDRSMPAIRMLSATASMSQ